MRIHHLNCGSLCPIAGALAVRLGLLSTATLVCHCLLIEAPDGLVLVDTGIGRADVLAKGRHFPASWRRMAGPALRDEETAAAQVAAAGFAPADVTDVIVTHLDIDHAGGLPDFPHARVHVARTEREALERPDARRLAHHFSHGPRWEVHDPGGDAWMGFGGLRRLPLRADIALLPLAGHTLGHAGVVVRTDKGWLLHAGDAYYEPNEVQAFRSPPAYAMRYFAANAQEDGRRRRENRARLRRLLAERRADVHVFCAHDPLDLERLRGLGAAAHGRAEPHA